MVAGEALRHRSLGPETPCSPSNEAFSPHADRARPGEGQRHVPGAVRFVSRSDWRQDRAFCQVSLPASTAVCDRACARADMDGRLCHSAWCSMERYARISGIVGSGRLASRSLCRRTKPTHGVRMKKGCLSKLQVLLRSELLVVAALKFIRDEDVREQKEEEI